MMKKEQRRMKKGRENSNDENNESGKEQGPWIPIIVKCSLWPKGRYIG